MRKLVLTTLFFVFACCGREALACSCIPIPGGPTNVWHKDRLKTYFGYPQLAADTIFLGTVAKIEEESKGEQDLEAKLKVTFAVERVWAFSRAGGNSDEAVITVRTHKHGPMCGVDFKGGERYFVFAKRGETNICDPTTRYADDVAADYYKVFGRGREPAKPDAVKPAPPAKKPSR